MILRLGSKGEDVRTLQAALRARGYYPPALGIDGDFGPKTDAAVREFQLAAKLTVDGVVGDKTWSALLDPASNVTRRFPAIVEAWRAWLERADADLEAYAAANGEKPDPFPIDRALRFMQLESGGNACATGRIGGDHVYEAGIMQTYFEQPSSVVHGVTSKQLRSLCACEGTTQRGAPCTDAGRKLHAAVGMADVRDHRRKARGRLLAIGVAWAEDSIDFWCAVKLVHALPGLYSYLRDAAKAGHAGTWAAFRAHVESLTPAQLAAIDKGTARYAGAFTRVFENCEGFARLG